MDDSKYTLDNDKKWIAEALKEAGLAGIDVPIGCVIVKDNQIIARGHNERESAQDPTNHAEIIAIREAAKALGSWRLAGCCVYTTLEPCPMCAEALIQARVERVVFGAYDPMSGACGTVFNLFQEGRIYPIPQLFSGVMEDECKQIIVDFFRLKPKTIRQ